MRSATLDRAAMLDRAETLVAWLDGRLAMSRRRLVEDATELFVALGDATAAVAARRADGRPASGRRSRQKEGPPDADR